MKKMFLALAAVAFLLAAGGVTMIIINAQSVLACAVSSC
jgi:hypothetical protein